MLVGDNMIDYLFYSKGFNDGELKSRNEKTTASVVTFFTTHH